VEHQAIMLGIFIALASIEIQLARQQWIEKLSATNYSP
jgi:hypothetical protein